MATLNQQEIENRILKRELISQNYDQRNIKEVCYETSTSNDFFELNAHEAKKIQIPNNDFYVLRPNCQVVCVTKEYFDIPLDLIARIILVGHYFSLGIAPVNTYADPGFKGRLGIVLTNTSNDYLKIYTNTPIAKIEFSTLLNASEVGYVGQHGGDVTVWPYRKDLIASDSDLIAKSIDKLSDDELEMIYGTLLKNTIASVRKSKWFFAISTTVSTLLPLIILLGIYSQWNLSSPFLSALIGVIVGVGSNLIFFSLKKKI